MAVMTALRLAAIAILFSSLSSADVSQCGCDASDPLKLQARECGLCREAEKQPLQPEIFYLKDNNPRKPNRWLVLTRYHSEGPNPLVSLTPAQRTALWTAAIAKATELWGDKWGLAMNGDAMRTQCHTHVHIGKLLDGVEIDNFVVVAGPAQIPVPREGAGVWVHPAAGGKLHVHLGEQITETVLLR